MGKRGVRQPLTLALDQRPKIDFNAKTPQTEYCGYPYHLRLDSFESFESFGQVSIHLPVKHVLAQIIVPSSGGEHKHK